MRFVKDSAIIPFFRCILHFDKSQDASLLYTDLQKTPSFHHLGGVFNSFYPYEVSAITRASEYGLQVTCAMDSSVRIWLHTPAESEKILVDIKEHNANSENYIKIPKFEPKQGQRLTFEIDTGQEGKLNDSSFSAAWGIRSNKSPRQVHLAIIWCTYNNANLVAKNIEKLVTHPVWNIINADLIIVDNNGKNSKLQIAGERTHHIKQPNVGGSGGFLRGINEVTIGNLSGNGFTHLLLMDDDVEFHPEIILRAISYHEHSTSDSVIGASMLELENPDHLHEAGGLFRSKRSLGSYTDVPKGKITLRTLEKLGRARAYHYNAWWFCSFPKTAVEKSGPPLSIFIHGDDMEYGLRLNQHGFKVFCPGGLSLWHKAFQNKPLTWIRYFDFRNGLIRLLTQGGDWKNNPALARTQLRRVVRRAIIRNDYGAAAMAIRAYRDLAESNGNYDIACYETKITDLSKEYDENMPGESESQGRYRLIGHELPSGRWIKLCSWFKYITINFNTIPITTRAHYHTNNARYGWWQVPAASDITVFTITGDAKRFFRCRKKALTILREMKTLLRKFPSITITS
jgi:galactofuranosylgalactofuranosylrhamnosyl-N-acetylglucosaminyl-diphospho-decaprenol beta-1,5/1,6-galactofuranosyltransferase